MGWLDAIRIGWSWISSDLVAQRRILKTIPDLMGSQSGESSRSHVISSVNPHQNSSGSILDELLKEFSGQPDNYELEYFTLEVTNARATFHHHAASLLNSF